MSVVCKPAEGAAGRGELQEAQQQKRAVAGSSTSTLSVGFALEYALGHITHAENLKAALVGDTRIAPTYAELPYENTPGLGRLAGLPGVRSNWSLRASLAAYRALKPRIGDLDAAFFHTQVTSLLSTGLMKRVPSLISLDATPLQYDALGTHYNHAPSSNRRVEAFKKRLNERAFASAKHLVTWSQWCKDSLVGDYGVADSKITVIPPGVDTDAWDFGARRVEKRAGEKVRLLFVGGDFTRKGGDTLLQALRSLPDSAAAARNLHLDVVTKTREVSDLPTNGVSVTLHHDAAPNSPKLRNLFAQADIFVFPTRADCLPVAVLEAMASGLPVITTAVGALPEAVTDGVHGAIIRPDDAAALADAVTALSTDSLLRGRLGDAARLSARERFDARTNARRVVEIIKSVA